MELRLPIIMQRKDKPVKGDQEQELISRLRHGDSQVIAEIFNIYADRVYTLVFHNVGRNQVIAEDISQEVFFHALKSAGTFKGNSSIFTWLSAIAHHKIADYYRRLERDHRFGNHSLDDPSLDPELIEDPNRSGKEMTENTDTRITIEQALNALPLEYRQVIILKYVEDMSVSEICRVMDRSPKSIEGLLSRARKALKGNLRLDEDSKELSGVPDWKQANART